SEGQRKKQWYVKERSCCLRITRNLNREDMPNTSFMFSLFYSIGSNKLSSPPPPTNIIVSTRQNALE
ncbi:hypothetical protein RUM43_009258, partial [Polyplax serrata]